MYEYMIGLVTTIKPKYIVLEVNGIGYSIHVGNPYSFKQNENKKIFLYNHVREDANILFGFHSSEEKQLFLNLLSVNGIGPKSALSIVAASTVKDVEQAIESGNAKFLMKFPGIGQKASQQIILDLKGKLDFQLEGVDASFSDVEGALTSLGYNKKEISKVISQLDKTLDKSNLIREALKLLSKV